MTLGGEPRAGIEEVDVCFTIRESLVEDGQIPMTTAINPNPVLPPRQKIIRRQFPQAQSHGNPRVNSRCACYDVSREIIFAAESCEGMSSPILISANPQNYHECPKNEQKDKRERTEITEIGFSFLAMYLNGLFHRVQSVR